jgi:hypothetical protein
MAVTRPSTYASRLKKAMDDQACTVAELALVCECSQQTIKDARSGRLPTLSTEHHFRAAFYLRVDPLWLAYNDHLPIAEGLAERAFLKLPSLGEYDAMKTAQRDAIHALLKGAAELLRQEEKQ